MAWTDIIDSDIDTESPIIDDAVDKSVLFQLRDNIIAWVMGLAGAPRINGAAFDDNTIDGSTKFQAGTMLSSRILDQTVGAASVATNAVRISHLDTVQQTLSIIPPGNPAAILQTLIVASGGAAWLGYRSSFNNAVAPDFYRVQFPGISTETNAADLNTVMNQGIESKAGYVHLWGTGGTWQAPGGLKTVDCEITYLDSSPPYNLGQGDIPLFVFMEVNDADEVCAISAAPTPPWAYNGPTSIRPNVVRNGKPYRRKLRLPCGIADAIRDPSKMEHLIDSIGRAPIYDEIEITPEYKNTDMRHIPHPFGLRKPNTRVVLIDPLSRMAEDMLDLQRAGEHPGRLFAQDYLRVRGEALGVITPPGIPAVKVEWRNT